MLQQSRDHARDVPRLGPRECQVWWASPRDCRPWHELLLDATERARRDRLRRAEDRDRFTAAAALTRLVLGAQLGLAPAQVRIERTCPHCGEPHGKPRVAETPAALEFSISHSGDRVVVAVAAGGAPLGVDVEQLAPSVDLAGISGHVLSPSETADFERRDPGERGSVLLRYWTRKEAVVKATGDGLNEPLANLTLSGADEDPRLLDWTTRPDIPPRLAMHDLDPGDGYVASLAVLDGHLVVAEAGAGAILTRPLPGAM